MTEQPGVIAGERTPSSSPLHIKAGDHLELDHLNGQGDIILPYQHVKMLGHGGSASVEMVRDTNTGSVYARKIIRNVYARNIAEAKRRLQNEVRIMQRLASHHHIVRVHATYIFKRELAIVLDPVADGGDLATFLQDYRESGYHGNMPSLDQNRVLRKSFGCLASGLAFMHQQTIRHKDIKPQNILIHQGSVIYTDFGLSYDFGDSGQSTTTGLVQGLTRRYCAPEVAESGKRNSKSDVFSLGCVYVEIIATLYPECVSEEILVGPFYEQLKTLSVRGVPLWQQHQLAYLIELDLVEMLLSATPSDRPSASEVEWGFYNCDPVLFFCKKCAMFKQIQDELFLHRDPKDGLLPPYHKGSSQFDWSLYLSMAEGLLTSQGNLDCCGLRLPLWVDSLRHYQENHVQTPEASDPQRIRNKAETPTNPVQEFCGLETPQIRSKPAVSHEQRDKDSPYRSGFNPEPVHSLSQMPVQPNPQKWKAHRNQPITNSRSTQGDMANDLDTDEWDPRIRWMFAANQMHVEQGPSSTFEQPEMQRNGIINTNGEVVDDSF